MYKRTFDFQRLEAWEVGIKLAIAERLLYHGESACILPRIKPARAGEVLVSAGNLTDSYSQLLGAWARF